jgi:membrane fusion protein, multidrug efflux system
MVERRVVRIGQRQEGRVEIVDGLKPGEIIVVRGVQRVRPGQIVDPKPASPEAPAAEAPPTMPKRTSAPTVAKPQPGLDTAVAERRG